VKRQRKLSSHYPADCCTTISIGAAHILASPYMISPEAPTGAFTLFHRLYCLIPTYVQDSIPINPTWVLRFSPIHFKPTVAARAFQTLPQHCAPRRRAKNALHYAEIRIIGSSLRRYAQGQCGREAR
jgi:hypothetical protein